MRILFIIHQFFPEFSTGTEQFTLNIAKTHQRNGHRVEVLYCALREGAGRSEEASELRELVVDGICVHGLPRRFLGSHAELGINSNALIKPVVEELLNRGKYDVVHVTHSMRMLPIIEVIREQSIPYLITLTDFHAICHRINLLRLDNVLCSGPQQGAACNHYCSDNVMTIKTLAERRQRFHSILSGAREVVACSDFVAEIYRRELPDLNIQVVGHGVDLAHFNPLTDSKGQEVVFGYLGTLSRLKGVDVLSKAFLKAAPKNARLELVGSAYGDDALLAQLSGLQSSSLKVLHSVTHEQVPAVLAGFDVLCIPSLVPETYSLALHEGFASGLPALVSDIGWPSDVVRAFGCGQTALPGQIDDWARAIREIAENREILGIWRKKLPLPLSVEEESFFYEQLYRRCVA